MHCFHLTIKKSYFALFLFESCSRHWMVAWKLRCFGCIKFNQVYKTNKRAYFYFTSTVFIGYVHPDIIFHSVHSIDDVLPCLLVKCGMWWSSASHTVFLFKRAKNDGWMEYYLWNLLFKTEQKQWNEVAHGHSWCDGIVIKFLWQHNYSCNANVVKLNDCFRTSIH